MARLPLTTVDVKFELSLSKVVELLRPVVADWKQVMLFLGVPKEVIDRAELEQRGIEHRKIEALDWWLRNDESASWESLRDALRKAGYQRLAQNVFLRDVDNSSSYDSNLEHLRSQHSSRSSNAPELRVIMKPEHVVTLFSILCEHAKQWNDIGLAIGFTPAELGTIGADHPGDVKSCLKTVLVKWTQWPVEGHEKEPTLEVLYYALRAPFVGLGNTAKDLKKIILVHHSQSGMLGSVRSVPEETTNASNRVACDRTHFRTFSDSNIVYHQTQV